ncbi:MAG: ribonuclease VapC [Nanoarchaeota archaeon]|nr:ribonuclease VapC [Nanoarchaeota archaeon]
MYNIILDTNFLLIIPQFKIDIFRELERICNFKYKISILDKTLEELKNKPYEKLIKEIIKKKKINIIKSKGTYVDEILKNIKNTNTIIATNDKELKKKLKTPLIILKQKKYLQLLNFNEKI